MDQNLHQLSRQSARSEEKFQNIRRQASKRGAELNQMIEDLHKQLIDAENNSSQVKIIQLSSC